MMHTLDKEMEKIVAKNLAMDREVDNKKGNKIAYKDDNQIVSISAKKVYAHSPKTVVEIKEI